MNALRSHESKNRIAVLSLVAALASVACTDVATDSEEGAGPTGSSVAAESNSATSPPATRYDTIPSASTPQGDFTASTTSPVALPGSPDRPIRGFPNEDGVCEFILPGVSGTFVYSV